MAMKSKRSPSHRVSRSTKKEKKGVKKAIPVIVLVSAVIILVVFAYYLGQSKESLPRQKDQTSANIVKPKIKTDKQTVSHTLPPSNKKQRQRSQKVKNKVENKVDKKDIGSLKIEEKTTQLAYRSKKPKLVIIIDDVYSKKQLLMIQKLHMKITPSIFPPFSLARKSHLLAKELKHFMIHLPMESSNRKFNSQSKTLMTAFSDEEIVDRVMELRRLFPNATYVNNHTGSVFTSDYKAMKRLYTALRMEDFVFIDSLTNSRSKVKKIAHEYGDVYVGRDIFIDNVKRMKAIHKQLRKAVKIAKRKGYAIAIGHPYKVTMKALKHAQSILRGVDVVYIDEIYRR